MNTSTSYTYLPAFKQFGQNVKIVHFLGNKKPWMYTYNKTSEAVEPSDDYNHAYEYLKLWWNIYTENIEPGDYGVANLTKSLSETKISASPTKDLSKPTLTLERRFSDDASRLYAWEHGQIDYLGRDSFENIQKKLDEIINADKKE